MKRHIIRAVSLAILLLGVAGCAADNRPDPRDTVKDMFTAMRNSDSTYLSSHIDFGQAAGTLEEDFLIDSAEHAVDPSQGLLSAMTGGGKLRARWLENQIVLGAATVSGDTAWVEVSFIDRLTRVQYYNKMRLDFRRDHWVINSFRTL
jgi:hypothetical protein